jgi:hypothetical protein
MSRLDNTYLKNCKFKLKSQFCLKKIFRTIFIYLTIKSQLYANVIKILN